MADGGYRATLDQAGVLDVSAEGWLRVHGKDARSFLHRMASAHVEKLPDGEGRRGLLLNVKGHIEADALFLAAGAEEVLVATPASVRQAVAEKLEKYLVMDEAAVEDRAPGRAAFTVQGPKARDVVAAVLEGGLPELAGELHHRVVVLKSGGEGRVVRHDRSGLGGFDLIVPAARGGEIGAALLGGAAALEETALDALRIEAGLPILGRDFGTDQLPQEARLQELADVAVDKCYLGQEVVSRLHFRGHPNKLLVALELDGEVAVGAKLERAGKDVGKVTSAALSPRSGKWVGLGYARREAAVAGTELSAGVVRVVVSELAWRRGRAPAS